MLGTLVLTRLLCNRGVTQDKHVQLPLASDNHGNAFRTAQWLFQADGHSGVQPGTPLGSNTYAGKFAYCSMAERSLMFLSSSPLPSGRRRDESWNRPRSPHLPHFLRSCWVCANSLTLLAGWAIAQIWRPSFESKRRYWFWVLLAFIP